MAKEGAFFVCFCRYLSTCDGVFLASLPAQERHAACHGTHIFHYLQQFALPFGWPLKLERRSIRDLKNLSVVSNIIESQII